VATLRVARSMRRGRGAAFSLVRPGVSQRQRVERDLMAAGPGERVAAVLPEEGRPTARRALEFPAGARAEYFLTVPPDAVLSFHGGARAEAPGDFDMAVEVQAAGGAAAAVYDRKFRFTAKPKRGGFFGRKSARGGLACGWEGAEIDLSSWTGRAVTLRLRSTFQADSGAVPSTATARVYWGSPVVWTPDERTWARRSPQSPGRSALSPGQNVVWAVFESFPLPSFHGAAFDDFPGLATLDQGGVEFPSAYANHLATPEALRSLMASDTPPEPGAPPAKARPRPLPEILRAAGYRTLLFGAPGEDPSVWNGLGFDAVHPAPPGGFGAEGSVRQAARWLAENEGRGPYFLVVFIRAPEAHEDPSPRCWLRAARLVPSALFALRRWSALAQAVQMDGPVRRLWEQVQDLGGEDHTLLAAASLRGAPFRPEPVRRSSDGRLFRRALPRTGLGLREEEVRVLWMLRHPELPAGRKVTSPAQLLDVAPTLTALLGLPPEPGAEGHAFGPANGWSLDQEEAARFLVEGAGGDALVLDGHYKYVRRGPSTDLTSKRGGAWRTDFEPEELFDLWVDPGERRNLARRRRHLLARARRAMDERRPERIAARLDFRGFAAAAGETPGGAPGQPLQGLITCPGGDLWNVALSTGNLVRAGANQVSFTVDAPRAALTFETWPPAASYIFTLRFRGKTVPAEAFIISRLGLPLIEVEKRNDWFDGNKFPWMDGFPPEPAAPSDGPRVFMGREPVPGGAAPGAKEPS
jgi:arylsulfatase A-like enzyme